MTIPSINVAGRKMNKWQSFIAGQVAKKPKEDSPRTPNPDPTPRSGLGTKNWRAWANRVRKRRAKKGYK